MSLKTITAENFEAEVLGAERPILLDFWASWCGPCKMLSPIVDEIAKEYENEIDVGKVNVDEQGSLAASYRVMSIPTLILFKDGQAVASSVGYRPKEDVVKLFK